MNTLKLEIQNQIALLTINREAQLNSLNTEVLSELEQMCRELSSDVRGLILTGSGEKAFIAGADIKAMQQMNQKQLEDFGSLGQRVTCLLENLSIPTLAAVNGFALGGGLEIALSCDFIFCSDNAKLGLPEVKLGLIPGFGGTQRLAAKIGAHRAKKIIFSAEMLDAKQAYDWGISLANYESKQALLAAAFHYFDQVKQNSPYAISLAKKSVHFSLETQLQQGLKNELNDFFQAYQSSEAQEGLSAFVEKRKANFTGK